MFQNKETLALLRKLAEARGLIVLTDSDGAGFLIRNFLKGAIPPSQIKHAYIPDIYGKERRKRQKAAEGKLGVEGMSQQILEKALRQSGATFLDETASSNPAAKPITKTDLYLIGLSGSEDSKQKRAALLKALDLPEHMTTKALLPILNTLFSQTDFLRFVEDLQQSDKSI